MEAIEFLEDKLKEGDYIRVCRMLANQAPALTIETLVNNIAERFPERGTGFYERLATLISTTLNDNLEHLHIRVLTLVGSRNLRETCIECIVYGLKERFTFLKTSILFNKLLRGLLR